MSAWGTCLQGGEVKETVSQYCESRLIAHQFRGPLWFRGAFESHWQRFFGSRACSNSPFESPFGRQAGSITHFKGPSVSRGGL